MNFKFLKTLVFSILFCGLSLGNNAYAGRSVGEWGDIAMFLANGWAIGMTMTEKD